MGNNLKKLLIVTVLIFVALVSILVVADKMTEPETYAATIRSIDDKSETVLKLTAASTITSAAASAIPGDTATPIAEKLADFTEYFLLVLCVLYAEKYLLTIIGAGTFKILIPLACALLGIGIFWNPRLMKRLAAKFAVFGLALCVTIPLSLGVSDMIYENYKDSIDTTIAAAEQLSDETEQLSEEQDQSLLESVIGRLSETASRLSDKAADILNRFIQSLAVMIVTSCVIPVLVLVFFIWLLKILTGVNISIPAKEPRHKARGSEEPAQ